MTRFIRPAAASVSFERPMGGGGKGAVSDRDHRAGCADHHKRHFNAIFVPKRMLFDLPSMG
jgi:hypothetical protein